MLILIHWSLQKLYIASTQGFMLLGGAAIFKETTECRFYTYDSNWYAILGFVMLV